LIKNVTVRRVGLRKPIGGTRASASLLINEPRQASTSLCEQKEPDCRCGKNFLNLDHRRLKLTASDQKSFCAAFFKKAAAFFDLI
jgi:hypothetical protein